MRDIALEIPLGGFAVAGLGQGDDAGLARRHMFGQPLDRAVLAGGVDPLEHHQHRAIPVRPEAHLQLVDGGQVLREACLALDFPVVSGNVSLYNETRLPDGRMQPIHPTPVVGMVGLVHDLAQVRGQAWREPGDLIWMLGVPLEAGQAAADPRLGLAGSSYLERIHGAVTGRPPEIDLALERAVQGFLRQAMASGLVRSAHDLSDGGLAVALAELVLRNDYGVSVSFADAEADAFAMLFSESVARAVVTVAAEDVDAVRAACELAGIPSALLGVVTAERSLVIDTAAGRVHITGEELAAGWSSTLPSIMA